MTTMFRRGLMAALLLLPLVGCGSGGGTQPTVTFAQVQAIVTAAEGAVQSERTEILAAVPADKQAAAIAILDGVHAAAVAVAGVDPAKATQDQIVAAVGGFISASKPLVDDLPIPANVKLGINAGLPLLRAFLTLIPPAPVVAPPVTPAPAPAPVPAVAK